MFKKLRSNPILIHQMRNAKWPSLRTAAWIAAALTLLGSCLALLSFAFSPDGGNNLALAGSSLIYLADSMLGMNGPLIAVVAAVVATVQAIDSQAFQIMRLSNLSEGNIVGGYTAAAAFRLRILWMLAGGLLLPQLIAATHGNVILTIGSACLMSNNTFCTPPNPSEILLKEAGIALIQTICDLAQFIAWHWFAITLGVWMAFRHRRIGNGLAVALIRLAVAAGIQMGVTTIFLWYVEFVVGPVPISDFTIQKWPLTILALVFAVGFSAMGKINFNRAVRRIKVVPK